MDCLPKRIASIESCEASDRKISACHNPGYQPAAVRAIKNKGKENFITQSIRKFRQ